MAGNGAAGLARTGYLPQPPDPAAPRRLFCFHHAGGVASSFAGWQERLGPHTAVVPVQLPGRERRIDEPRLRDLAELVEQLDIHLDGWLRPPYLLYGHSMGALIAYALTQYRQRRGRQLPERLLVGGYPAPHRPHALADADRLPDPELAERLIDLGGISPVLRGYPEWLNAAVSLIRDDLAICTSHSRPSRVRPLPCPIEVFHGADDPLMNHDDATEWVRHTSATCTVHVVPGGHFFPWQPAAQFLELLSSVLGGAEGALLQHAG